MYKMVVITIYSILLGAAIFRGKLYDFLFVKRFTKEVNGKIFPRINVPVYLYLWRMLSVLVVAPLSAVLFVASIMVFPPSCLNSVVVGYSLVTCICFSIFAFTIFSDHYNKKPKMPKKFQEEIQKCSE